MRLRRGSCNESLVDVPFFFSMPRVVATQIATLIESNDGPSDAIMLPGRMLTVPSSITLPEVQALMYPSGGVVYPAVSEEWYCPGP